MGDKPKFDYKALAKTLVGSYGRNYPASWEDVAQDYATWTELDAEQLYEEITKELER